MIENIINKELQRSDRPLCELLLFAPTEAKEFKLFLCKLATVLSLKETKLTAHQGYLYSVVIDEK